MKTLMETNKVIEQDIRYNIEIGLDSSGDAIILTQGTDLHRSGIGIEKSKATEVAKAICPKYQELEESYAKVLEALDKLLEYGDRMVELYRESVEKIKSDESKTEDVKIFQMRLSQGKFYGWRDSMKFLRQAIQQSETKSKDNE